MQTTVPDSLAPGLTDQQLECLNVLRDGEWHDYDEISRRLRNFIRSNISGRIIGPLKKRNIIEQDERPVKEGSRKIKKLARIRKDIDAHTFHLLIEYSANDLILKYNRKTQPEKADFFLKMRDESIRKLVELEKHERECQQKAKEDYWKNKESSIPYSESWPELVTSAKRIANHFERLLNPHDEMLLPPLRDMIEKIPATAFLAACDANPALFKKAVKETKRYEWKKYYGIDLDEWEAYICPPTQSL